MMTPTDRANRELENLEAVAGNGLLHWRALLRGGAALAGAMTGYTLVQSASGQLADDAWSLVQGATVPDYGVRSASKKCRAHAKQSQRRTAHTARAHTAPFAQRHIHAERPAFRDFTRRRSDIDPDKHRLVIHGLVKQPLVFTLDALARYPMASRMAFVECGGNSAPLFSLEPIQASVQALHGLV